MGTVQGSTLCPYTVGDGIVEAAINPDSLIAQGLDNDDYDFYLYNGVSTDPADIIIGPLLGDPGIFTYTELSSTLAPGFYTVVANEKVSGSYCPSVPLTLEIDPLALPPVISLNSALINNTSCDSTVVNGQIDLLVSKDPDDLTGPATYALTWNATAPILPPSSSGVAPDVPILYTDLNFGTYEVTVVDENSTCENSETYVLYNEPPEILVDETTLIVTDKYFCVPSGHIEITNIEVGGNPEPLSDFTYEWYDGAGSLASNTPIGAPAVTERLDSITYAAIHDGTYFVVVTKDPAAGGEGAGCESTPFSEQIVDRSIDPTIVLSQTANLACDSSFATGTLSIAANTGGSLASDYEFTINSTALMAPVNGFTGPGGTYTEIHLGPGQYGVTVRDVDNECISNRSLTVDDNPSMPYVLEVDLDILPQTICDYDGSVTINAIRVNGIPEIPGTNPGEVNYEFTWYADQPLPPDLGVNDNVLDVSNYPIIQAGIFYFKALRNNNAHEPGEGCETAPYPVEIEDVSIDPTINLSQTANQACDLSFATGTLTLNVNTGGIVSTDYEYTITSPVLGGPLNGFTGDDGTPGSWTEINLEPGQYNVEVLDVDNLCINNGIVSIQNNPAVPYVEAADLTILPQVICANDGSIMVNSIRINGVPETPGTNPGEVNYLFTWYEDQVAPPDLGVSGNILDTTNYPGIQAGTYYFTALRDQNINQPGEGCESAPFAAVIDDVSIDPTLILAQMANQACDLSFVTGSITLNVSTGGVVSSDYEYTITSPVLGGPLNGFTGDDGTPGSWTEINLGPGQYSVQVIDADNFCTNNRIITVNDNPEVPYVESVDLTIFPQSICANDGSIVVNSIRINGVPETPGTNPGEVNYLFTWYENLVTPPDLGVTGNVLDTSSYPGIQAGTYYFTALRDQNANQPGEGCETAPFMATIDDVSVDPLLALTSMANQSCDTSVIANGSINAIIIPGSNSLGNFNYTWLAFPAGRPTEYTGGTGTVNEQFLNLTYGQYNLEIEDEDTRCSATRTVTINNNPFIPVISDYVVEDQAVCFNDGSITVLSITPGDTSDYDFTWYQGVTNYNNNLPIAGVFGSRLDTANYASIQAGDFYFTAIKTNPADPVGFACESSPVRATIRDVSINPFLVLTPTANQNCDLSFANGTLTALASTNGIQGPSYSFTLTSSVLGAPLDSLNQDADVFYSQLQPGTYNVLVVDDQTLCTYNRNTTIDDSPVYIDVNGVLYTVNDQTICAPDGSVVITSITDQGIPQPLTDFTYSWFEGESNLNADNPIFGVSESYLDTTNYASIGAGTFFFTLTKSTGTYAPGEGCESAPLRADIYDRSTDPNVDFVSIDNTSCDITLPNGEISAIAFENDGTDTDIYSFTWTLNGNPLPPGVLQSDSANTSVLGNAPEGNYQVTVINSSRTQCRVNSGTGIDFIEIEPNIILVDVTDPFNCFPTGQLEVTEIWIGGLPANVNDFEYEWYQGNFTPGDLILDSLGNPITSPLLQDQLPDRYYVLARNIGTSCESNPKEAAISEFNIIYPEIYIDAISPQTSCDPTMPNAALLATVDGGNDDTNPDYQFQWFNSLDGSGPVFATTSSIFGLGADNYSVTVLDLRTNCTSTDYYITEEAIDLYKPVISVAASPQDNCVINNGSVSAEVINYNGNFEYNWYIGDQVGITPDFTGQAVGGLPIGLYTVVALETDTTFCLSDPVVVEIRDERIKPVITITEDNPLTFCWSDDPNGQFTATVNGMVGGYTFEWYNGSDTTGMADYIGSTYAGLAPQTYTVVVTDNRTQCDEVASRTINDSTVTPPMPDPEVVQHYLSCIEPDGWVRASVDGDVINYIFDWYDGNTVNGTADHTGINYRDLVDGFYTVTAMDMVTGCISPGVPVEVLDQRELPAFTYTIVPAKCESMDGSVEIVWENDVPVDRVIWIDPVSGGQIDQGSAIYNYPPGFYGIIVTSIYGCVAEDEVEIPIDIFEFNGISANGDGRNDYFEIACITNFPLNNVKIFNRAGQLVYEADGYNNADVAFKGIGENGMYLMGRELPDGTYFYIIDKRDGSEPIPGYLELIR